MVSVSGHHTERLCRWQGPWSEHIRLTQIIFLACKDALRLLRFCFHLYPKYSEHLIREGLELKAA